MIQTISYQVYDNGTGGRIGDVIEMQETFDDHKALEIKRKQLKKLHRIDADSKHVTIYFQYKEPLVEKNLTKSV